MSRADPFSLFPLGGDSDTIACIAGGIAQAYYGGVPEDIQEQVFLKLDSRQRGIVNVFMERYCSGIACRE